MNIGLCRLLLLQILFYVFAEKSSYEFASDQNLDSGLEHSEEESSYEEENSGFYRLWRP